MACKELDALRKDASALYCLLQEKTKKAQEKSQRNQAARSRPSDYEPFLKHKLTLVSAKIEDHIAKHRCK